MTLQKMDGEVPENGREKYGKVSYDLKPSNNEKTMNSMKAPYAVKRITFNKSEANPGDTLDVHLPKLNKKRGLSARLTGSSLQHRPFWRARQQLSRPERIACACEPASSGVWGNDLGPRCGLRHIQDIHRLIFARGKAWKHVG